jgi:hypothetical protein
MCEWAEIRGDRLVDGGGTALWATGVDVDGVKVIVVIIALCKKVGHGHFSCHTSVLRRVRPGNTFLSYLYNNTMYSYKFSYIWNLLFELEMLMLFSRNLHHYKKSKFQKGGLDDH